MRVDGGVSCVCRSRRYKSSGSGVLTKGRKVGVRVGGPDEEKESKTGRHIYYLVVPGVLAVSLGLIGLVGRGFGGSGPPMNCNRKEKHFSSTLVTTKHSNHPIWVIHYYYRHVNE